MWKYLPFIISSVIILSWPHIYASCVERKASTLDVSGYSQVEFRIAGIMYIIFIIGGLMFLGLLFFEPRLELFTLLPLFFAVLFISGIFRFRREKLVISETSVIYTSGKKQKVVERAAIQSVAPGYAFFTIKTHSGDVITEIHMFFERPALILALLRKPVKKEGDVL